MIRAMRQRRILLGKERDRALARDHAKMPAIERENAAGAALGARDHGGVRETERQVGIATHQIPEAGQILIAAIERELSCVKVSEEVIEHGEATALLDEVGHLAEDAGRHHEWPGSLRTAA